MVKPRHKKRFIRRTFFIAAFLVSGGLITSGAIELYFRYDENIRSIRAFQQEIAVGAAFKIAQFIKDIERDMRSSTQIREIVTQGLTAMYRFELVKLLKGAPAIMEAAVLTSRGNEFMVESRMRPVLEDELRDRSSERTFLEAQKGDSYLSPIYFVRESEPYMTIGVPIKLATGKVVGVLAADVNLSYVREVISDIRAGEAAYAYVVSSRGDLIAHSDMSLVLQKLNLAGLAHVKRALSGIRSHSDEGINLSGERVLSAYAAIPALEWIVFVEQPANEAYATLYASISRTSVLLLVGLAITALAAYIVGRQVIPAVEKLRVGAARIGEGSLDHRIDVRSRDEFEAVADAFNQMAENLQRSYDDLKSRILENQRLYGELQRSHDELVSAQAELVRKAKLAAMGEIAASVAHETRNPLGTLTNCLKLLKSNPHLTSEDAEVLELIQSENQRLNRLVSDFLAFGRPRPPQFESLDLHALIDETLALIERNGRRSSTIDFVRRFDASVSEIRADRDQLRQLFWNLFINAVEAMKAEGQLAVVTRGFCERIEIRVEDTGPGISNIMLQQIFEPFHSTKARGTGLGLAICRRIVEDHGGTITVENTEGKGSCFRISLPR